MTAAIPDLSVLYQPPEIETHRRNEIDFRWATVTTAASLTPTLRIQLDGETLPLPTCPDALVIHTLLTVNKRVWVQLYNRRVIVLGVAFGL